MTTANHAVTVAESVSAALAARGVDVSPALVFGLGEGLDFTAELDAELPLIGHRADFARRAVERLGGRLGDDGGVDGDVRAATPDDVRDALLACALAMDTPADPARGLEGLATFVDGLGGWAQAPSPAARAARAGRCIAEDGAAGALCRRLYRDFLRDSGDLLPALVEAQLSISMTRVGDAWATLGRELAQVGTDETADLAQAGRFAIAVQTFEETFWARVMDRFGDAPSP